VGVLGVPTQGIPEIHGVLGQRLMTIAMGVCDIYGDSPQAREQMREQIAEVPTRG
jgi:hypothetical protein